MECLGVASDFGEQEVDVGESIGVASGCSCKEVYRHITYPYSSCIFLHQHSYTLFIFLCFSFFI